jgi:hypothetical protein
VAEPATLPSLTATSQPLCNKADLFDDISRFSVRWWPQVKRDRDEREK